MEEKSREFTEKMVVELLRTNYPSESRMLDIVETIVSRGADMVPKSLTGFSTRSSRPKARTQGLAWVSPP